jgi:hypothetical protein
MSEHAHIEHGGGHGGDKRIALLIAILALFLALVGTGAKSSQTEVITHNVEASNLWAFFQARTIRQTAVRTAAEQAEVQKATTADPAVRAAIEAQQKEWRDTAARWESEPSTGEGRKELTERAQHAEAERDLSMAKYHFYEYSAALFEIAIVIASASIVTSVPILALLSILLGVGGLGMGAIGFFAPLAFHF